MDGKKKNSIGRPTKYKKEYCQMLEDYLAEGFGMESFASKINVNQDTLYEWCKKFPEFSESQKRGFSRGYERFEKIGQSGMVGKLPGFNVTAWIFWMKNRYGWRDRQEVDHKSSDGTMSPTQEIDLKKLSKEQLLALRDIVEQSKK